MRRAASPTFAVAAAGSAMLAAFAACVSDDGGASSTTDAGWGGDVGSVADESTDGAPQMADGGQRDASDAATRRDALGYPDADSGVGLTVACSRAVEGAYPAGVDRTGAIIVLSDLSEKTHLGAGPISGPGAGDLLVAKFDASCNLLWTRIFGDSRQQAFWHLAVDENDDIIVYGLDRGATDFGGGPVQCLGSGNAVLVKFSPAGAVRWSKSWGAAYVQPGPIAVGPGGEIAISGMFGGDLAMGGPQLHGGPETMSTFVAKFDTNGGHLWSHKLSPLVLTPSQAREMVESNRIEPGALAINANGDVVVALWDSRTDPLSYPIDLGGGPIAFSGDQYGRMSYVVQYDADGVYAWSAGHRGRIGSMGVDPAGYVVSSEEIHDPLDPYYPGFGVSRRSPSGVVVWSKPLVPPNLSDRRVVGQVYTDSIGRPLLIGSFFGSFAVDGRDFTSDIDDPAIPTYYWDALALQLDRDAKLLWADVPTALALGSQSFLGGARGPTGHVAALLHIVGTVTIGGTTYTSPAGPLGRTLVLVHYRPGTSP